MRVVYYLQFVAHFVGVQHQISPFALQCHSLLLRTEFNHCDGGSRSILDSFRARDLGPYLVDFRGHPPPQRIKMMAPTIPSTKDLSLPTKMLLRPKFGLEMSSRSSQIVI